MPPQRLATPRAMQHPGRCNTQGVSLAARTSLSGSETERLGRLLLRPERPVLSDQAEGLGTSAPSAVRPCKGRSKNRQYPMNSRQWSAGWMWVRRGTSDIERSANTVQITNRPAKPRPVHELTLVAHQKQAHSHPPAETQSLRASFTMVAPDRPCIRVVVSPPRDSRRWQTAKPS
jgi:hypothetical protein